MSRSSFMNLGRKAKSKCKHIRILADAHYYALKKFDSTSFSSISFTTREDWLKCKFAHQNEFKLWVCLRWVWRRRRWRRLLVLKDSNQLPTMHKPRWFKLDLPSSGVRKFLICLQLLFTPRPRKCSTPRRTTCLRILPITNNNLLHLSSQKKKS